MHRARDIAVSHCLWAKQAGLKPCDVLASVGAMHRPHSSWQQAITVLARVWQSLEWRAAA